MAASSNRKAAGRTLAELERMGRLEDVDAARRQVLLSLASAVDRFPDNAALWRQYREAIGELTADDDGNSSDVDELLERLRSGTVPAEVRNSA